ncbi:hypothetical protein EV426DRAFT_587355 [Tirmania nivea]|nr:hypothetical protein EV426DRAFT_587355 [Tirmania nivea]
MRLAVYGAVSTLAALGVVISAFAQRANFYSATVYLAQSNACLMILTNFSLLCSLILAHILQRILYGPLRDLEVESLYEKAWYAITETCLAMTIFRDEWNVGFVLCFAGLLFAKGFCWLSSGRVEMMEQTPPANPRLFHIRLVASLLLLIGSDIAMVYYAVSDVLEAGKPGMMVMFAFEFTILLITALSTAGRYGLIMSEKLIVHKQANARRLAREAERAAAAAAQGSDGEEPAIQAEAQEDEEPELVWEEKGTWMFYLELGTDFLKLLTYLAFFFIVLTFYGLPLHIIRDVYITLRSFISRIRDFIRYRRATNDMNIRYPDATVEEVERENVCIICREEMRPFIPAPDNQGPQGVHAAAQAQSRQRMRPKKLPCGHILHFSCLRSWLERQQRCPTCRRPVLETTPNTADPNAPQQGGAPQQLVARGIALGGQFGGIRINFGVGQGPEFIQNLMQQWDNRQPQEGNPGPGMPAPQVGQQGPTGRQQEDQQDALEASGGAEAVILPQQAQNMGTSGLINLRGLHIQCLELERRLRRELEAIESLSTTIGNARDLRSRISQARQQQPVTEATPTTNSATAETPTVTASQPTQQGLQGIQLPPGWQMIPLTPVGVGATSATPSLPNTLEMSANIATTSPPHRTTVSEFPATLADIRRRRFGRGDIRNYNATLRDYHAVRSPGLERSENGGGLGDISSSAQPIPQRDMSQSIGSNDLQRRFRELRQDSFALDESTELLNSAGRELELAPSHSRILAESVDLENLSEECISQAEREMASAFGDRRAVLALVHRILDESQQVLGERRIGSANATVLDALTAMPQATQETRTQTNITGSSSALNAPNVTESQPKTMTPIESASSSAPQSVGSSSTPSPQKETMEEVPPEEDRRALKSKGKGRALSIEAASDE